MPKVGAVVVSWSDRMVRPQKAQCSGSRVLSSSLMGVCASRSCGSQGPCQRAISSQGSALSLGATEEHEHERAKTLLRSRCSWARGRGNIGTPDGKFDSDRVPGAEVCHRRGR